MLWKQLKIGPNDRAILIGATGCGKTTLARYLIEDRSKPFSVVYDAKISDNIGEWPHAFYESFDALKEAKQKRLIFRPDAYEALDENKQDEFFEWVYQRKHCRLYVDEAYALLGGTSPAFHLLACLSRGRERGISTIIATQRPKRIPLVTLSEAEHVYIFRLNLEEDRNRVYQLTGIDEDDQRTLGKYEFFYCNLVTGLTSRKLKLKLLE